jgi:hypothetical protein
MPLFDKTSPPRREPPPLDLRQPPVVRTATFALG